jgi:hypothetical protein
MKNESMDLNDHLFAELERLGDESLTADELMKEAIRAKSICEVAEKVVANQAMTLKAYDLVDGSFGKKPAPSYFRKELSCLEEKKENGKITGPAALLQFKGDKVSRKDDKGEKLRGDARAL